MTGFKLMFAKGLRSTMVLIVPLAALLATLSTPVIMLYRAGRFTAEDVPIVAGVLMWWALGLTFFAGYMFVLKTFYSLQDTKTPMYTNMVVMVLHIGLYALLALGIAGWGGLGIIGIPIADGASFAVHMLVLVLILRRRIGGLDGRAITLTFLKVVVASAAGALAAWALTRLTGGLMNVSGGFLIQLLVAGVGGLAVAYVGMSVLRVPELADVTGRITRKLARRREAS
jgi:putative peptidoglycan lipid II flippase